MVRQTVGRRAEAEERRQLEVGGGGLPGGVGAEDEVGDVGGRAAPLGDGLCRGGVRELWYGGGSHVYASVQGWQLPVDELRVGTECLLGQVEAPFLDAGFLA